MTIPTFSARLVTAIALLAGFPLSLSGMAPAAAAITPVPSQGPPPAVPVGASVRAAWPAVPSAKPPGLAGWPAARPAQRARFAGWVPPLAGPLTILRPFVAPAVPWGAGHRGVDLAARPGEVVRSAGAGTVAYAGLLAGRYIVSVAHERIPLSATGPWRTTYEGVQPTVAVGQSVDAGQQVGTLAPAGGHCSCLHWGLRQVTHSPGPVYPGPVYPGPSYLDPMRLLAGVIGLKPTLSPFASRHRQDRGPLLAFTGGKPVQ